MDAARQTLATLALETGQSLAQLSVALGRNAAYLQQYLRRGSPRTLDERDRRFLAAHFGVDEAALGGEPRAPATTIAVPWLDVSASAGPGAAIGREARLGALDVSTALLREAGVAARDASIVAARGDSMAPTILDGDRLLVDSADRRVSRDDMVVVKRLSAVPAGVRVVSDNPLWPDEVRDDIAVIGRVKLLIRTPR